MRALRTAHPLDKNVYLLNLLAFFNNAMFVIPIIVVYYEAHKSVGFTGFLIGEAAFSLVLLLMEVPSGYISDIWKRKSVLWVGMFIQLLGYALLWLGDGLVYMVLAQSIVGIGCSLYSGTNIALLHDGLVQRGKAAAHSKYAGQMHTFGMVGGGISALIGGWMYATNPQWPAMWTVLIMVFGVLTAMMLKEPERHKQAVQNHPLADMIAVIKYTLHGHKEVACLIAFMTSVFVTTNIVFWIAQRYWAEGGISEAYFGMLMAGGMLMNALGAAFAHKVEDKLRFVHIVSLVACIPMVGYGLALVLPHMVGVFAIMFGTFAWGVGTPLMSAAVNLRIESARRATVLSVKSLVHRLAFLPLSLVVGPLADGYSAKVAIGFMLCFLVLGVCFSFICMARHNMLAPRTHT